MTNVDIYLTINKEFKTTLEKMIEEFPEEYEADKKEGLDDYEFVKRTFKSMGEDYWEDIFGYGVESSDIEVEVYD